MMEQAVSFLTEFYETWAGIWGLIRFALQTFADMGLGGIERALEQYGTRSPEATPTTKILGVMYVIAALAPGFLFFYIATKSFTQNWKIGLVAGVGYIVLQVGVGAYMLGIRATPFESYGKVAYGPLALYDAFKTMVFQDLSQAFMVVVSFTVFFLMSWLMWYIVNMAMYSLTVITRSNPIWSNSDPKGHAFTFAIIWIFYLSMTDAGGAFLLTLMVIFVIIYRRKNMSFLPGGGKSESEKISQEELAAVLQGEGQGQVEVPQEGGSAVDGVEFEWINEKK